MVSGTMGLYDDDVSSDLFNDSLEFRESTTAREKRIDLGFSRHAGRRERVKRGRSRE